MKTCSVEGCDREVKSRGVCHMHYQRWKNGALIDVVPKVKFPTVCSVKDCERKPKARGLCVGHYERRRHGKPLDGPIKGPGVLTLCARGHASSLIPGGRDIKNRHCKECRRFTNNTRRRVRRATDPVYLERDRARSRKRYATDPAYRATMITNAVEWGRKNRPKRRASVAKHYAENPGKRAAKQRARTARKLGQICACCTPEQIRNFYVQAHAAGREVDHSLALARGGLHCLQNLVALTPAEHKFKTAEWDAPLIAHIRKETSRK